MNCPACSQEISDLSEFCPNCHVRVKGDLRCADCKFVLAPNAKACPSCGSKKTEPRLFQQMPKNAATVTHRMAEISAPVKSRPPRRLGRLKHRTNAQPIGWSNLFFAFATMAGFLFLPIFQIPNSSTAGSIEIPVYTYWRLVRLDGSWTIFPPSPRLLFALLAVVVASAIVQRVIRWSPIAFMTQVVCSLGVLITMVDAVARAKDSLIDVRSPYAVLVGALLLIVIPWRHLDRHDFSKPRPVIPSPDDVEPRGIDLRSKNVLVAGIAIVFAVLGIEGSYQALSAALPASSTSPVMNGASVNALLLASSGVAQFNAQTGGRLLSYQGGEYGVSSPLGMASDGSHVWVANAKSNTVTEFAARTGTVVRVISSANYALNDPTDVVSDGRSVYVLNSTGNSVTQINAHNGQLVRVMSGSNYGFNSPTSEALAGGRLWVTSPSTNIISLINARTGSLVNRISSVTTPTIMAAQGSSMWVANSLGAVVRVDGRTNQITGRLSIGASGASAPGGMAVVDNYIFVSDPAHAALWEFDVNTMAEVRNINGDPYGFTTPGALGVVGSSVLVLNTNGNVVTVVEIISTNAGVAHRFNVADVPYPGFGSVLYSNGRVWVTY